MRATWTFGKVFGIPIGIHSGWVFLFLLVTWSLATGYFPGAYPGWSPAVYWLVGLFTSLLVFASLLAHEVAHAVVAQHEGVPVRGITLFLLGGIAQLGRAPPTPGAELRIAAAGPLVSLVLGLSLTWLGSLAGTAAWVAPVLYLGRMNILLAGFNLLPGFPMDGGRLLRALLWAFGCDVARATRIATQVGLVIASFFVLGGVLLVFSGQFFAGLWIAFIGWFLHNAASQSWQQVESREKLQGLRAEQIMNRNYTLVEPDLSLEQLMSEQQHGGKRYFMVTDAAGFAGMLTLPLIRSVPRQAWPVTSVGEAMTTAARLHQVAPGADLAEVLDHMISEDVNQVPVVEQGGLVGLVTREELLYLGQRQ